MEAVALEWISSFEIEPRDVVQFIQQLNNVPEDAVCEVGDIFSRRCRTTGSMSGDTNDQRVRNEVHLSCEPHVAEFLCRKFVNQTQHVTGGEVIRVRCKRVYPGAKPLGRMAVSRRDSNIVREYGPEGEEEPTNDSNAQEDGISSTAPVLPIEKVIALIDLLGDQVVDAQEAYELFADRDARGPQRMTLLGLTKALTKLCKYKRTQDNSAAEGGTKVTVENLRYLLSKLIASNSMAVRRIPTATTVPFISYTDFLAGYVAFLANLHAST